ncbi:ATP-binding protein [Amycolatopsis regifaucium]|uniref:histidine kinase n=1 Tax=Amycolatopsis regifaucium TaxID=546365 RepID=A0A154MX49_9PSEU|nr:ATP-binding protein [Amycolatopsis regifaucium]KZB88590.1 histidine kinase [Amycolatopsis regifaucium]OKA07239.1 two-component sensor histidine kinase [Amycolatopsis regifaucium]SFI52587.1 two-component system, OmpR family, sensor histidine kinase MtrB [Amycolatopsis regifaucium]
MKLWGLRTRLLLAFSLLVVITAATVAGVVYALSRTTILQQTQDSTARVLVDKAAALYPLGPLPPSDGTLSRISGELSDRNLSSLVFYADKASGNEQLRSLITPELREHVQAGHVAWQRVVAEGAPMLVVGTRFTIALPNGQRQTSGIEAYIARSMIPEEQSIGELATRAWLIGGLALVFAIGLALLAARGVLRPVRELGDAAHRLGEGDLRTRISVRGSDELAGVARTFNEMAEALQSHVGELKRMEADARRFVADVSHELRTPLAALTAVADVLEQEAPRLSGDAGRAVRLSIDETHHLTRLVNDLIEVSRFDAGAASLALEETDVAEVITASLRVRGWAGEVDAELPTGIFARLDPRRLDVIVANLVGNALRHGEKPVSLRLAEAGEWCTLEVADRGPGLAPEVLPHVFDRFYKADSARKRSGGSGLGLAIAWENARLHGGTLSAANGTDGGAVFTVRLPRQVVTA